MEGANIDLSSLVIEVAKQGMTVEESLLATHSKGVELEHQGDMIKLSGILTRGKAYVDYLDEGFNVTEASKFFGVSRTTIIRYRDIYNYFNDNYLSVRPSNALNLPDTISVNKLLSHWGLSGTKGSNKPKQLASTIDNNEVIEAEVVEDERLRDIKEKIMRDNGFVKPEEVEPKEVECTKVENITPEDVKAGRVKLAQGYVIVPKEKWHRYKTLPSVEKKLEYYKGEYMRDLVEKVKDIITKFVDEKLQDEALEYALKWVGTNREELIKQGESNLKTLSLMVDTKDITARDRALEVGSKAVYYSASNANKVLAYKEANKLSWSKLAQQLTEVGYKVEVTGTYLITYFRKLLS